MKSGVPAWSSIEPDDTAVKAASAALRVGSSIAASSASTYTCGCTRAEPGTIASHTRSTMRAASSSSTRKPAIAAILCQAD